MVKKYLNLLILKKGINKFVLEIRIFKIPNILKLLVISNENRD